jgi:cyanophycinase-like exopeptidase
MPASTDNELVLIGGYLGRTVTQYLASRSDGEVGIVTFARDEGNTEEYIHDFVQKKVKEFGEFNTKVRHVKSLDDLQGLSLVLYVGGNPHQLAAKLKETGIHLELLNQWRRGEVVLAGSSAGAMVLCGVMLEDPSDDMNDETSVELTYGLAPLGACFVVPHWSERTTQEFRDRLIKKHGGGYYIWGIDENTALSWRAGHCKVTGEGKVYAVGRMKGEWGNGEEFDVARGW